MPTETEPTKGSQSPQVDTPPTSPVLEAFERALLANVTNTILEIFRAVAKQASTKPTEAVSVLPPSPPESSKLDVPNDQAQGFAAMNYLHHTHFNLIIYLVVDLYRKRYVYALIGSQSKSSYQPPNTSPESLPYYFQIASLLKGNVY
jgi:hypothetical protein